MNQHQIKQIIRDNYPKWTRDKFSAVIDVLLFDYTYAESGKRYNLDPKQLRAEVIKVRLKFKHYLNIKQHEMK